MDTSDDPATLTTLLLVGGGVAGGLAAGGAFGGGGGPDIPSTRAEPEKRTAERVDTGTEAARRRRARRQSSLLTRDFEPAQLGTPGLFGAV